MVSELMGHRNIQTTMRYLEVKNTDALQAVQTLVESPGPCLVKKDRQTDWWCGRMKRPILRTGFGMAPRVTPTENGLRIGSHEVPPNYLYFVRHRKRLGP